MAKRHYELRNALTGFNREISESEAVGIIGADAIKADKADKREWAFPVTRQPIPTCSLPVVVIVY